MIRKLRKGAALAVLREELDKVNWPTDYDFTVKDEPIAEAADLAWWLENADAGQGETARNKAYFRAYVRIANGDEAYAVGDKLPAQGLRLQPKGRLSMDRYVIGKMTQRGFLEFQAKPAGMYEPAFVLTKAGKDWIEQ